MKWEYFDTPKPTILGCHKCGGIATVEHVADDYSEYDEDRIWELYCCKECGEKIEYCSDAIIVDCEGPR